MHLVPLDQILDERCLRRRLASGDVSIHRNRVAMRRIQTGPVVGINWAVESGLAVNEKVIVEGVQKVRPGQQVKTTTADEQQGR